MQSLKTLLTSTGCILFCAGAGAVVIVPPLIESNDMRYPSVTLIENAVEVSQATQLPTWLQALNLSDDQIRQVFEIDTLLEQRLELILTSQQYSQWQASRINLSDEAQNEIWTFKDLNIELSPYQQTAVNASFQAAMQSLLDLLSPEQRQQLRQYLEVVHRY